MEEGQGAAVGNFEKGVAVVDFAADLGAEGALAPGGDEGNAEDVLDEMPVRFLVFNRVSVVMHAKG